MMKFKVNLLIILSLVAMACQSARRVELDNVEMNGGETSGGETSGGETSGGETSGGETSGGETSGGETSGGETSGGEVTGERPLISLKPALKRKDYRQLSADLSSALELDQDELCNELGTFPCLESVHRLALGGIAPETQSIYFPNAVSSVSAPIALERVVYAACGARIKKDFQDPTNAKIFKLNLNPNGTLSDPNDPNALEMLSTLFRRALLREASEAELNSLRGLYVDIAAEPNAQLPGQAWSWASCLAIFTSAEFIFY